MTKESDSIKAITCKSEIPSISSDYESSHDYNSDLKNSNEFKRAFNI